MEPGTPADDAARGAAPAAAVDEEEALRRALAASLAEQADADADADLQKALEASRGDEDAQVREAVRASTMPEDLDALTDQERDAMTVAQLNGILEDSKAAPMVSEKLGVSAALGAEYADNPQRGFATSIRRLDGAYASLRRVRKDGNCFYRGFLYRYLEELLVAQLSHEVACGAASACPELARIRAVVRGSKAALLEVGYEEVVVDDFWETLVGVLDRLPTTTPAALHRAMNEERAAARRATRHFRVSRGRGARARGVSTRVARDVARL